MGLAAERASGDSIRIVITDGRSSFDTVESDEDVKAFMDSVDAILAGDEPNGEHAAPDESATDEVASEDAGK